MKVTLDYNVRGGLKSLATASYDSATDELPAASPTHDDSRSQVS
jgi:hypothetical protein